LPPSPATSASLLSLALGTAQAVTSSGMHYHRRVCANCGLVASRDVASGASILGSFLVWTVLGKDMYRPIA
jgi:Flp pilus assembly protein CpaB